MESEFRLKDLTYIPDSARISARKNLDTIQELLKDPYKLNLVVASYSSYDDHLRRLAKKIKNSKSFVLRSFIEELLREPEIAVELYEHSESLPDWFREVLRDFVISVIGRIKLRCDL
jgi:hypothetical protein